MICITSVIGFYGKYASNIFISKIKYEFDSQYNITNITNITDNNNNITISQYELIFDHDRNLFSIILGIYFGTILLSIILYISSICCIFETKKEDNNEANNTEDQNNGNQQELKDGNKYQICNVCGYTIYSEEILIINEDRENNINNNDKKCCKPLYNCILYIGNCFKLLCCSIRSCCDEIVCSFFCLDDEAKCCCCYCCPKINDAEYEKQNKRLFCYCIQGERKLSFFNRLIRNKKQKVLMPIMLEYFILQLSTIGFEHIFDKINEEEYNNYQNYTNFPIFNYIFVGSLLYFFYLTFSFGTLFHSSKNEKISGYLGKISNAILNGTYGIIIFNSFFSFICSIIILPRIKDDDEINSFKEIYIFIYLIPIFMNKFYFFTFTHYCTNYSEEEDGFNKITTFSTLISIYLHIWDIIFGFIKDNFSIKALLIIQIAISFIIVLITIIFIFICLCCLYDLFWVSFLYLITFPFCFGGIWLCCCFNKFNCNKDESCCQYNLPCSGECCHNCCNKCCEFCLRGKYQTVLHKIREA